MTHVGKPMLPIKFYKVLLPPDATLERVEILSKEEHILAGKYNIYPAQPPRPISIRKHYPFVEPKEEVYSSISPYPAKVADNYRTGTLTGFRIGSFSIAPLRYIPAQGKLTLATEIKIRIYYSENSFPVTRRAAKSISIAANRISKKIINPENILMWAPPLKQIDKGSKALPEDTVEYVIITSASLSSYFDPLINWKTKKGVPAQVMLLDTIYANYSGVDNAEKVRNFIRDADTTWGTLWFLLGGQCDWENNEEIVPRRDVFYYESGAGYYADEDTIPSDLYYSDLDGSWNDDGDNVWGESNDGVTLYSDVYVGRAPVLTATHVQTFIDKVLAYEKTPPSGYLKRMFFPSAILWSTHDGTDVQDTIANRTPAGWTDIKLFEVEGNLSQSATIDTINIGVAFIHFVGHGNESGVYLDAGGAYLNSTNVDNLTNGDKLFICNALSCMTGAVDYVSGGDCFAEHFLTASGAGVASIMNSRYGWGNPNQQIMYSEEFDTSFYHEIFVDNTENLGIAHAVSKDNFIPNVTWTSVWAWIIYELNLFGDPELPMWTEEPDTFQVTHNATVPMGSSDFTVNVKDNDGVTPIQNALVCLMCKEDASVYKRGYTNSSGDITLTVSPSVGGDTMWVTVTKHNYIPYEGFAEVLSGGPWVSYLKHTIADTVSGNNNGILNHDETIDLPLWAKNVGGDTAFGVVGTLLVSDPKVSLIQNAATFGNLAPNDSAQSSQPYRLSVDASAPDGYTIACTLRTWDNSANSWTSTFSLTVVNSAPMGPSLSYFFDNEGYSPTMPTLTWIVPSDPDNNVLHFKIQWDEDVNFGSPITIESKTNTSGFSPLPPVPEGTGTCSYTVNSQGEGALSHDSTYWWRVAAWDGSDYGPWSAEWSFTVDTTLENPIWYQTKGSQFETDLLNQVFVMGDSVELGSGSVDSTVYDFSSGAGADKWAYGSGNAGGPPPIPGPDVQNETEISDYTLISASDDNRLVITKIGLFKVACHHFKFTIAEPDTAIDSLYIEWEGYGERIPNQLWIWNFNAGEWVEVGSHDNTGADEIISITYIADIGYYIVSDTLHLAATENGGFGTKSVYTDYVKIITYYSSEADSGIIKSTPIVYDNFPGLPNDWEEFKWTQSSTEDSIKLQVEYLTGGSWALVPDAGLPNNSQGFFTSQLDTAIDISALDPATHDTIRLVATLYRTAVDPALLDWMVSVKYIPLQLSLTTLLQGYYDPSAHTTPQTGVKVELRDTTNPENVLYTFSNVPLDTTGSSGWFELTDVIPGDYYLAVKKINHLAVITDTPYSFVDTTYVDFTVAGVAKGIEPEWSEPDGEYSLRGGDVVQDGLVWIPDYCKMAQNWGTSDSIGDIDGDGTVFISDYDIMALNWTRKSFVPEFGSKALPSIKPLLSLRVPLNLIQGKQPQGLFYLRPYPDSTDFGYGSGETLRVDIVVSISGATYPFYSYSVGNFLFYDTTIFSLINYEDYLTDPELSVNWSDMTDDGEVQYSRMKAISGTDTGWVVVDSAGIAAYRLLFIVKEGVLPCTTGVSFSNADISDSAWNVITTTAIDTNFYIIEVGVERTEAIVPLRFELSQNSPNPFMKRTVIRYGLPRKEKASLKIYDAAGRCVKSLVNEEKGPGYYNVSFEAKDLGTGIYFTKFIAGDYKEVKKLVLMR